MGNQQQDGDRSLETVSVEDVQQGGWCLLVPPVQWAAGSALWRLTHGNNGSHVFQIMGNAQIGEKEVKQKDPKELFTAMEK